MTKRVDIVFTGSLNQIIGPMGTIKRIIKNQEYFNSRGYKVSVFTNDSIPGSSFGVPTTSSYKKSTLKGKVKSLYKRMLKHSYLLDIFDMERTERPAIQLANYYLSLNRDVDIVQFHSGRECQQFLFNRKNKASKTILFQHSDGLPFEMSYSYYPKLRGSCYIKKRLKKYERMIDECTQLAFIANKGKQNFIKAYPSIPSDKISLILNGIDELTVEAKNEIETLRQTNEQFPYRLCSVGTINGRKGQRLIIEALNKVNEDVRKKIHVSIVGEGQERTDLEELTKTYHLTDNIDFEGAVPNELVYKNLARSNIFILMSYNEGMPISIIEAMRNGLPIISTRIAGIPELVREDYNGKLLDPNADQLADLLNKIDNYDWKEMGCHSRSRFEKEFTFERMEKEFCDMYDQIMSKAE